MPATNAGQREKAIASCLFAFVYFRARPRRRFFLQPGLIEINRGTDEVLQGPLIDLVALEKIDRASGVAFEAGSQNERSSTDHLN
jgi:hypothetical protein